MKAKLLVILLLIPLATASLEAEAERVLWENSYPTGIMAGSTHFSDLWARDALYASWGATTNSMYGPVRGTLNTLARHQSPQGQIPLRVGSQDILLKLVGLPTSYGPVYENDKSTDPALDPNCLYVITLNHYVQASNDQALLEDHRWHAEQAIAWLNTQREDTLLHEEPYASWDDALRKHGASIYNNACYYAALKAASNLTGNQSYADQASTVRKAINDELWNSDYYDAWTNKSVLDVPGNLLAIEWGVANDTQTTSILNTLEEEKQRARHILPKTNYPAYSFTDVYLPFYFIGMDDYHDQGPWWSWIAALEAKVRADNNQPDKARAINEELERWVDASGSIHETYQAPEEPLDRLFYNSEQDFSWTAGLILYSGSSLRPVQ